MISCKSIFIKTRKPQNFYLLVCIKNIVLILECHTYVYHIKGGTIISAGFSGSGTNRARNFLEVLHSVHATLSIFYSVTALRLFLLKKIYQPEANIFSNICKMLKFRWYTCVR